MTNNHAICSRCEKPREPVNAPYDYTLLAGLDAATYTVLLYGVDVFRCECGLAAKIPNVDALHAAIIMAFLESEAPLDASAYKFIRKTLGMTQKQFAELMDRTPVTICKWENQGPWPEGVSEIAARALVLSEMMKRPELDQVLDAEAIRNTVRALTLRLREHRERDQMELFSAPPIWKLGREHQEEHGC